jgi:hypothetical protein
MNLLCRITELEKDLYYYKSVSRELKKKLRQLGKDKDGSGEPAATRESFRRYLTAVFSTWLGAK